jgi:hypothetical protein
MKCRFNVYAFIAVIALTVTLPTAFAQSSPPLLTNNPGTPGDGKWEINLVFAVEKFQNESLYEAPALDINYGLGERMQVKYEVPWLFLNKKETGTINGLGNSEIGFKYRFLDEKPHGVSMSVYPQLSFNNPTSSADRGLVDPGMELTLPIQIARHVGPLGLNLNIGYSLVEHQKDEYIYGLAVALPLVKRLEIMGEVNGAALRDFSADTLVFNLGGLLKLHNNINLFFSAGRGFRNPGGTEPELLGFAGLQFTF